MRDMSNSERSPDEAQRNPGLMLGRNTIASTMDQRLTISRIPFHSIRATFTPGLDHLTDLHLIGGIMARPFDLMLADRDV